MSEDDWDCPTTEEYAMAEEITECIDCFDWDVDPGVIHFREGKRILVVTATKELEDPIDE